MMEIRSAYGKRKRVQVAMDGESLTKQSFKDDCDINKIVKRYQKTGVIEHVSRKRPRFGDAPAAGEDLLSAYLLVEEAEAMFSALPADIRRRFENDPAALLKFMDDPNNQAEAEELGLVAGPEKRRTEKPQEERSAEADREPPDKEKSSEEGSEEPKE